MFSIGKLSIYRHTKLVSLWSVGGNSLRCILCMKSRFYSGLHGRIRNWTAINKNGLCVIWFLNCSFRNSISMHEKIQFFLNLFLETFII